MPEVRSKSADTSRLRTHYLESGPEDGIPVVLIHGNLASARFFDQLMAGAPERYRMIAPDMRSFGDSEPKPIDASRGLRDWADDTHALVEARAPDRGPSWHPEARAGRPGARLSPCTPWTGRSPH